MRNRPHSFDCKCHSFNVLSSVSHTRARARTHAHNPLDRTSRRFVQFLLLAVPLFLSGRPWQVAVFSHMQDLPLHRQKEEGEEIEHEDGPEHGHVENFPKCHKDLGVTLRVLS